MTEPAFWALIEESRTAMTRERDGNMDRQVRRLSELLHQLAPEEIFAFEEHFGAFATAAADWNLRAVAYIIGEGCSDDGFEYFRFWLISLGRAYYERALEDPVQVDLILSETHAEDIFFEGIAYVAGSAYRALTRADIPDPASAPQPSFRGAPWRGDEELRQRYPALCAKYWDHPE